MAAIPRLLLACPLLLLVGCWSPLNTRFPQPYVTDPRAEGMSYRFHDPFPDNSIGPETATRPPSYMDQRSLERRAAENRMLRGYNLEGAPAGPAPPRTSYDYPQAVQAR